MGLTAGSGVYSELLMALYEIVGQLRKIAEGQITVKVAELLLPLQLFLFLFGLSGVYSCRVKKRTLSTSRKYLSLELDQTMHVQ